MGFETRDYSRDGRYTASLSGWGMELTPVVKYLIIANVVVFVLQLFLTRPAAPRRPDFDVIWSDQEETAPDAEPPARRSRSRQKTARATSGTRARPARPWRRC